MSFKGSNATKPTPMWALVTFGLVEAVIAYFSSADWVHEEYIWGARLLPVAQLAASHFKLLFNVATPPAGAQQVTTFTTPAESPVEITQEIIEEGDSKDK